MSASTIGTYYPQSAYATVDQVRGMNLGRPVMPAASVPSGKTEITEEQVVGYLEETAGVLDGILRERGYSVPVSPTTAPFAFKTLEGYNAIGAAYRVEMAAKNSDRREEARKMWESAQKMLSEGTVEFDAERDTALGMPLGGYGPRSSAATPFFTRNMAL
jgi:hypothetical protein